MDGSIWQKPWQPVTRRAIRSVRFRARRCRLMTLIRSFAPLACPQMPALRTSVGFGGRELRSARIRCLRAANSSTDAGFLIASSPFAEGARPLEVEQVVVAAAPGADLHDAA